MARWAMEFELRGIKKSDAKRVYRASGLCQQLEEDDLEIEGREELLREFLGLIKQLARKYPVHPLPGELAVLYITLGGRFGAVMLLMERLKSFAKDAYLSGFLGEAYFRENQLFSAYENMSFYIENAEEAVSREYRSMFETLKPEYEKAYREFVEEMGIDPRDQQEHEKGQILLQAGELGEASKIITGLSKKYPHVSNVMNNMGIILLNTGRISEAESCFQKVLSFDAENAFALAQSARTALYRDDFQTAVTLTERLMKKEDKIPRMYYELIQLNAFLGRDEAVRSLYREYDERYPNYGDIEDITIGFFGGVALLRTGSRKEGIELLEKNRKINNIQVQLPEENLADSRKPLGEQNGPAYFSFQNLFPPFLFPQLKKIDSQMSNEKIREILSKNKKLLIALLPVALRGGDEHIREWYIDMYDITEWNELRGPLSEFMSGQTGSDELRRKTFQVLSVKGKTAGQVEMYRKGEKAAIRNIKITEEPRDEHLTEEQRELNNQAFYFFQDGDNEKAADLWEQYLHDHGDDPSVLNNLAAACEKLGRINERTVLVKKLGKKYPDYFFYRILQVRECIDAGDFGRARTILDDIGGEDEYHVSEMKALCNLNIMYYIKKKDPEAAAQWYKSASICLPDDPEFNDPESLKSIELFGRLKNLLKLEEE